MFRLGKSLVLLCGSALLLSGCSKKDPQSFSRPPSPVIVAAATEKSVPVYIDEVGRTTAREVVSVQPQVSGRITEILFRDGANLKKGDPLFTIDPRPFQAQLDAAQANLIQSKAALDFAKIQFARVQDLVDSKAIARQDYDTRKNAVDVGAAQVAENEAAVESAKLNLEYTSIRSPIDGRAGRRLVDIGNIVTANSSALLTIERLDPIYGDFTVTENDFPNVERHARGGDLRVEIRLPDQPDKPLLGRLTFLDNEVQASSGTVMLRATIPNPEERLWPGQFINVRLILSTLPDAVLVPATATQDSAQGPFV
ncbi:MAG: efflux RND transporter periplasmic adaptor subunit, partial [Candidatus Acidiferrales bacterium]